MILNSPITNIYYDNGVKYVKVSLLADTKPDELPINGEGIKGLTRDDHFGPGSTIVTVNGDIVMKGETSWGNWL